jgi:hypothetical protein
MAKSDNAGVLRRPQSFIDTVEYGSDGWVLLSVLTGCQGARQYRVWYDVLYDQIYSERVDGPAQEGATDAQRQEADYSA